MNRDLLVIFIRCDYFRLNIVYFLKRVKDEALYFNFCRGQPVVWARGGVMIKALGCKSADRGFDSRCCHWNFSVTNLSGRTTALGSNQPVAEMSTRCISWE